MSFSKWQWRTVFALDVIIKFTLAYGGAVLASIGLVVQVGIEYVVAFAIAAVAAASLNAIFLLLGQRVIASLDWPVLAKYRWLRPVLILFCANAMFAMSWIFLFAFHGGVADSAIFSLVYVATNLIPIVIVASFGYVFRVVKRVSSRFA